MTMLQQSGSSGVEQQAKLEEWRRNWAPPSQVATEISGVNRSPVTVEAATSVALIERSGWTVVQTPFLASSTAGDDVDGSVNRVSATQAYKETNA